MQGKSGASLAIAVSVFFTMPLFVHGGEPPDPLTFEKHVRPIFKALCFSCHGEEEQIKGKLDLRLVRLIKKG